MRRWLYAAFLVLLVNSAYLWAYATPSIFYMANVLLHAALGCVLALTAVPLARRNKSAAAAFAVPVLSGMLLVWQGALTSLRWVLWLHIAGAIFALALLILRARGGRRRTLALCGALLVAWPAGTAAWRRAFPDPRDRIRNPDRVPASMEEEGTGPKSPFWPSSIRTAHGGLIPSRFFLDSEACAGCHRDIYLQWKSSAHHFASFNNPFYRRSIEHMQEVTGTRSSRWCAGCHDHAVLLTGRWDTPIKKQVDSPEAQAGLGCVSCHSIVHVDSSMGQGGLTLEYPALHDLAASGNRYLRALDRFLTFADPEPHRRTFMKPFMRHDSAEFCSTCHKVHLDKPVNDYRWLRGFNDYDNWQASGVSGQGARSFYYPAKSSTCSDCHMPLVPARDPAARDGKVHSHRFPAANTALAHVNRDEEQMRAVRDFLTNGFITVDIFAASPVEASSTPMIRRSGGEPRLMSTFAVGEEAESAGQVTIREVGRIAAPLDRAGVRFGRGETVRVDVVVRTRKIGHFFPGGTVDAFDVWLELQGRDAGGRVIYWSGRVEDGGTGPVESGAHFYRSFLLDADGNHINKRNAWQARSALYVRLIPPGAADVAHYRVRIPEDARGPIQLTARLNYRKFAHFYNQFTYQNGPPALPVVTLARAEARLEVGERSRQADWRYKLQKEDRERWNDWGIGLLLQGDLKGAEFAFRRVAEAEPGYADGWVNLARALIQEGETEAAKPFLDKAIALDPTLGRAHFFRAMTQKADGDYDAALGSLERVAASYPRDRVVLNQMARVLFLKRDYTGAIAILRRVAEVDPEDLQMHYTLMLCYRGLGDSAAAARQERLFLRFKADETSQELTAKQRRISPEDNNERQQIHDHESVPLP
jgi:tetratricopeptide (TPR) repeat protein